MFNKKKASVEARMRNGTVVDLEEVEIKEETPMRSSPDSSTDPWGCPQCGQGNESEAGLLEHLLQEHQIRVVPPQSPSTTRCPVCRKHVADLPHHFALEHGDKSVVQNESSLPSVPTGASLTRIIPIVLPSQPSVLPSQMDESESHNSARGDLNNITIIPMSNGNGYSHGGSTRSSTPSSINNDNPVNLSMRKQNGNNNPEGSGASSGGESSLYLAQAASQLGRKRRKQTHVPEDSKDERYWARRLKNNEAAKKSRDMRIRREKVIFEENIRLETMVKELRTENEGLSTENKELHLKLGLILDENARLKGLLGQRK